MASAPASAAARLCTLARRTAPRFHRTSRIARQHHQAVVPRAFSTSTIRWRQQQEEESFDAGPIQLKKLEKALLESSTPEGLKQLDELAKETGYNTIDEYLQHTMDYEPGWAAEDRSLLDELMKEDKGERPNKNSFWFDDEDPDTNTEEHDEFNEDDITSMAHGKLDEVREMRHYARLAVWEMPLLAKLAKPFTPPTDTQVLRWRYTTYMGEFHPAEKKVVVQFAPEDLKLTPVQTEKLKKLAGPRYNPETELIKMSSESFEHQAQNKRYLSDLVDSLIAAAKDPKDTFEDVPLDTRHHKTKPKPKFPREWYLTDARREELAGIRKQAAISDVQRAEAGLLVDGSQRIDTFLEQKAAEELEKAKMAELIAATPKIGGGGRARR